MYIDDKSGSIWDSSRSSKLKKVKKITNEVYDDGIRKTKLDPYKPEKFRKKINLRDIDLEKD